MNTLVGILACVAALALAVSSATAQQVLNPGFELAKTGSNEATNWNTLAATGGTLAKIIRTNDTPRAGSFDMYFESQGGAGAPSTDLRSDFIPVTFGTSYKFAFWAKHTLKAGGANPQWDIFWYDAFNLPVGGPMFVSFASVGSTYTLVTNAVTITPPSALAVKATVGWIQAVGAGAGDHWITQIDDVYFAGGGFVNSWTDGSGKWETADNWSLGAPASFNAQNLITNAGNNTVTIDSATLAENMIINYLELAGFGAGVNTLQLTNAPASTLRINYGLGLGHGGFLDVSNSKLQVGTSAVHNVNTFINGRLLLRDGGSIIMTNITLNLSNLGEMTVSNGLWLARNVNVYAGAALTVAGGTSTVSSNLILGPFTCATTGTVNVVGGSLFVTNALTNATLEVRNGLLILSSGTLVVDRLVMTNACGTFIHTGGTLIYGTVVLTASRDDDGDGISNGYEEGHGLDPLNAADANVDSDGDGLSNLQEFLAGTDATNSLSSLRIAAVARVANTNTLVTWTMGSGKTNALQRTAGVSGSFSTNNFADIFTVTNTVGTTTNYLDIGAATNAPSLYYRVRLVQ